LSNVITRSGHEGRCNECECEHDHAHKLPGSHPA
jgi:hypothetical protein